MYSTLNYESQETILYAESKPIYANKYSLAVPLLQQMQSELGTRCLPLAVAAETSRLGRCVSLFASALPGGISESATNGHVK